MASIYSEDPQVETWDIVVIIAYFAIVLGFGIWSSLRNRGSVGGYFLAGRSMHFIPVGASLFASNIGSGHFIGLAGSGAASGIGIAAFELNALFVLLLLGWIFVPVYIASGVFTMPEYINKRFGGERIRIYLAVLALLLSIFTKVAADLYAGAIFIEQALRWDIYTAIVVLLAVAALFTITGGLTAVIWTDFIQTVIMIIGAAYLMVVSFIEVGGYSQMVEQYFSTIPNTTLLTELYPEQYENISQYSGCGYTPDNSMHLLRAADDPGLPWTGIVFGLTISSIWYWCSDQVIVQRALASKNLSHAKAGTMVAGYLKILPMWLLVFPGMISRILYPDEVGCAVPEECAKICGTEAGCTNIAYPTLVLRLMPIGAKGLMLAVMMAALMSSLTSIFNSSSTIFTIDIWCRIRKNASETEMMIVGRCFVLLMVIIGIVWIPIVQNFAELFHYIQAITSYLAPPICAVYILAVFWTRANEKGAFWGLMVGLVVGLIRFIWEFSYTVPPCGESEKDKRPSIIKDVHYLHFGCILWLITLITTISVSLLTKPIDIKHLHRLTFWSRHSTQERVDIEDKIGKKEKQAYDNPNTDVPSHERSLEMNIEPEPEPESTPCWKKSIMWICGIEKQYKKKLSPEEQARHDVEAKALEEKHNSLEEDPFWYKVLNVNAIIIMSVAIFFWGFFY